MFVAGDDGPTPSKLFDGMTVGQGLGLRILYDLATQLRGSMTVTPVQGTEVVIEFPLDRPRVGHQEGHRHGSNGPADGSPADRNPAMSEPETV